MIETDTYQSNCKKDDPSRESNFQKNHQFSKNCSSLPLSRTHFVTKERHITDMSSIRKKIKEPWDIDRETCGRATEIAMFACFCPSKKTSFFTFSLNSPVSSRNSKKLKKRLEVWTNPIFCTPDRASWSTASTLNRPLRTDKKKQSRFLLVWWRHLTECYNPFPLFLILCQSFSGWTNFQNRWTRSREIG